MAQGGTGGRGGGIVGIEEHEGGLVGGAVRGVGALAVGEINEASQIVQRAGGKRFVHVGEHGSEVGAAQALMVGFSR